MIVAAASLPFAGAIPPSHARIDALFSRVLTTLRPPPRLRPSEWADEKFYLSPESAAEPGRWKTLPYQVGILDAFADPLVEHVSVMKSARVGWTKCMNVLIGYHIDHDPCPIMVVQPTIEDAQGYSKEEIAPMVRDCPALTDLVSDPKSKDGDNTILHKLFRGGSLSMVGANSARGFRRVSRRIVLFDEIDGYPPSAGPEGDQIRLGIRRTEYYWNRKIGYGSTPTIAGRSRIEQLFEAGDRRRFYVPCPHCGHAAPLVFREDTVDANGEPWGHFMTWPSKKPAEAHFVCRECACEIEHKHKRGMIEDAARAQRDGEPTLGWVAHAPFEAHASFHIWAAYSFSPNATWAHLATEFVEANRAGAEDLKTFVNTALGETWKEKGEAPEWERLYWQREQYDIGTCPDGVLLLTAGVDVQRDRIIYEVVGWGRGKASWSIDVGIIPGSPADFTAKGPWVALDQLLARRFRHSSSGLELPILMMAVDSGNDTQNVYNWVRLHAASQVMAVKGFAKTKTLVGAPTAVDVTWSGRRFERGCKMWPVGVDIIKSEFYGLLRLQRPTPDALATGAPEPAGACHFPEHGEDYFKQITAEELVPHTRRRGYVVWEWQQIKGRENHYLDCRVYARAAASVVGLDRFTDRDWERFESALAVASTAPTTPRAGGRRVSRSSYLNQ